QQTHQVPVDAARRLRRLRRRRWYRATARCRRRIRAVLVRERPLLERTFGFGPLQDLEELTHGHGSRRVLVKSQSITVEGSGASAPWDRSPSWKRVDSVGLAPSRDATGPSGRTCAGVASGSRADAGAGLR